MGGRFALASDVAPTRPTPNVFGLWGHPTPRGGCAPAPQRKPAGTSSNSFIQVSPFHCARYGRRRGFGNVLKPRCLWTGAWARSTIGC